MMNMVYFHQLGYKTSDPSHNIFIIKNFQRTTGIKVDGIIGPQTRATMRKYNKWNYCPEVFKPIKPYVKYKDSEIESLLIRGFVGLGEEFNYFSRINDFDVLNNIAHGALESGWGTSKIARDKNNLYGWMAYDSSAYDSAKGYDSYRDCIETWSREYNQTYLIPSGKYHCGNNEFCVNVYYASSSVAGINKAFLVQNFLKKLGKVA